VDSRSHAEKLLAPHTVIGTWFTSVLEEALSPEAGDYTMGTCPVAEDASKHLINLPTHLRAKEKDVERIVSALSRLRK